MRLIETNDNEIYDFNENDRKGIGRRIKKVREARRLKQSDIAEVLGHKDTNKLSRLERGEGVFDILTLMGIHQSLCVPLVYLLYGIDFDFPDMGCPDYPNDVDSLSLERERTEREMVIEPFLDEAFGVPLNEAKPDDPL